MNLGTLTIEMAANVARLQQDLQAARGSVDSTFQSIGSSVAKLKMLVGTVFAGIAVGSLLEAVDKVKTAAVDIERIAAASGASLDEFQRAAAGAKTVGVGFEKFGDIMKDTQDKLGDFLLNGGGELKDFFETIAPKAGVTAESFRNLSGPQGLQLFYTSLEKAGVGQKVMIQQMESIANDASALAPLLANGGAEFKKLGDEAARAGALMSGELIYASKALNEEMMRMDTVTTGISNAIMSGVIPALTEMAAASRDELSAGFEAVSAWVQDNKEQLVGAWEIAKQLAAEVWSIAKVAAELAVGIAAWAVESGFLEASLITVGLLIAGAKDGVDIIGAAFAKLGSIILNAVAKPMSGFLNDVGVVLKWAGQGDLAGVFLDAAEGIKTAGEAGAQYAAGVVDKFAAGDTAVARFTAGLGASTQAAQAAAKSTYTAYQALGTGAGISAKAAEEAKKSADKAAAAAQKLAEEGVKLAASLLAQDSGLSGDFAEKWNKLNAAYRAGAVSISVLTKAQSLLLADQPAMKAAVEERKKQLDDEAAAWTDVRKAMAAYGQAQEQAAQGVADGNKSLREEIELIGLSSKEQTRVLQQRTQAIVLTKQHTLAEMERQAVITGTMTREQIALAAEIEGLQERNELLGAQEARESWTGFWESVNSTAHDTFVNVAEEGMGAFKRIGKTLKSAVLDMLYQMTLKKWIVSISGSLTGALAGGVAQAATGGGGGGDIISSASNAYSLLTKGVSGSIEAGFAKFATSSAGQSLGLSTAGVAGNNPSAFVAPQLTSAGSQMGAALGVVGNTLAGYAMGSMAKSLISGGYSVSSGMETFQKVGIAVGSAIGGPVMGAIVGAAAGVVNRLFGRKLKDSGIEGNFGGASGFEGNSYQYLKGGLFRSDKTKRGELDDGLQDYLSQSFKVLQTQTGAFAETLGLQSDKVASFTSAIKLSLKGLSEAEATAALEGAVKQAGNDLAQTVLGTDTFSKAGEAAGDTLARLAVSLSATNGWLDTLGLALKEASLASASASSNFIELFGSMDTFNTSMASYYENFYPEAERMGKATASLTAELAKYGEALPESKAAYRDLVEKQLAAGESGAELAAKLLLLNGSFAEVTDYAEQAAKDAEQAAKDAITSLLDAVGIGAADMGKTFRDVLTGRADAQEAGQALAQQVQDGIYNALAGNFADQLTDLMTTQLIQPVIQAAVTGASISELVSQSAIDNMVAQARAAAEALGQIFSDPAFRAAIDSIGAAISGALSAAGSGVKPYSPAAAVSTYTDRGYADASVQPAKDAWRGLIDGIVRQTQDATRELSRLGMTGYEAALASIADKAQEQVRALQDAGYMRAERDAREVAREVRDTSSLALAWRRGQGFAEDGATIMKIKGHIEWATGEFDRLSAALAKLPPEVQAMADAETALLQARNARAAGDTVAGLAREIERLGLGPLEKELASIADRSAEYVKGLQDLGQGTDANIAAVKAWQDAMAGAALSADAAAKAAIAAQEAEKLAADKATADKTVALLGKEVAQMGMSGVEREIAGIAERANDYRASLVELGQSTDANIRAVNQWQNAMMEAAMAAQAAADIAAAAADVQQKFAARNAAGALKDRLQEAMGGKGTFAAQREGELWSALSKTGDYEKQVGLATQLTDMVLARQQLEVQNAGRLLDFGRNLRGYVDGLKIGALSPLTMGEKLAEAQRQYQDTLAKAQGGDATAQSGLQGIASSYLDLARTYFAGNEQFAGIFGSVTQSLDALGAASMTEAQQQLAIGTQSLSELQKLYSITETAYSALDGQYETAVTQLAKMQDALVLQTDSLEQLKTLATTMAGLPAEIAVRMPVIDTSAADAKAEKAASDLLDELRRLREEVAQLRSENRQDAQMQASVTAASADASAGRIAQASAQAVRASTVQQGATLI